MKFLVIGAHLRREDIEPEASALAAGPLFLSALELADDHPLGDRDLLLRVANVRARLLEKAMFVAIRYGFAPAGSEAAAATVAPHLTRWSSLLETHRDRVEMTLKVAASAAMSRPERSAFRSGGEYLRALHGATRAANVPETFRSAAAGLVEPLAVRAKWIHRDERSLELALLVERARVADVLRAGETLRERAGDVPFLLSGPWPLEVFADDDHE